jgi:hypothetical protein
MSVTKRFVLCDPNITANGGHYLEYAIMVLTAAERLGYEPVLAVSNSYQGGAPARWTVLPVFEYTFWGRRPANKLRTSGNMTHEDRRWLRLKYSRYGLLWAATTRLADVAAYTGQYPVSRVAAEQLREIALLRALAGGPDDINNTLSEYFPNATLSSDPESREIAIRALRSRLRSALSRVKAMDNSERQVAMRLAKSADTRDRGQQDLAILDELGRLAVLAECFSRNLGDLLKQVPLTADCHVLFPTFAYHELRGLHSRLSADPFASTPIYHIVLRRNVYDGGEETYDEQEWSTHFARTAFGLFRGGQASHRVRFYTDTATLARQYDRLGVPGVIALPVPVDMRGRAAWSPCGPTLPTLARKICLIQEVTEPGDALEIVAALDKAHQQFSGYEVHLKFVVDEDKPLLPFLAAFIPSKPRFGSVEIAHPRFIDRFRADAYDILGVNSLNPAYDKVIGDALDFGIPVITPSGGWHCAAFLAKSHQYHEKALSDAEVLVSAKLLASAWGQCEDAHESDTSLAPGFNAYPRAGNSAEVAVEPDATHVRIILSAARTLLITIIFRSSDNKVIAGGRFDVIVPAASRQSSLLLPVPAESQKLAIFSRDAVSDQPTEPREVVCSWVRLDKQVAIVPGGLPFVALAGDLYNSIIQPILNAIDNNAGLLASIPEAGLDPALLARSTADRGRSLVAAFLGDARSEKGYHLLPNVLRAIRQTDPAGRVRLSSQVYYPAGYHEPECVAATALLEMQTRRHVTLIPGALDSTSYARQIVRSDVILVPYVRTNYISRSSGIFTEALAAGIPSVVPGGTWMSSILDSYAFGYHLDRAEHWHVRRIPNVNFKALVSGTYRSIVDTDADGSITLSHGIVRSTLLELEADDEYVWINFDADPSFSNLFTRFDLSFQRGLTGEEELEHIRRVVGGGLTARYSILERKPREALSLWIGVYPAYANATYTLRNMEICRLAGAGEPIASLPGGLTFCANPGEDAAPEIAKSLLRLCASYRIVRNSAEAICKHWASENSPERLVQIITAAERPTVTQFPRFAGTDWLERHAKPLD